MKLKKKLIKNFFVINFLALLGLVYILIVRYTSTFNIKNKEIPDEYYNKNKPFIIAFWHGQLLMFANSWKYKKKINILASGHNDGQFGAMIANYLGAKTLKISDKNKKINIRPIFELLRNSNYIAITPDGPRGPKEKVSEGIIKIAKQANVPIIPLGFWSSRNFQLKSWDSFLITLPFSKCNFVWNQPIKIPKNLEEKEISKFKLIIEKKVNSCIQSAKTDLSV